MAESGDKRHFIASFEFLLCSCLSAHIADLERGALERGNAANP